MFLGRKIRSYYNGANEIEGAIKAHPNVEIRYNIPMSQGAPSLTSKGIGLLDFRQSIIAPLQKTGREDALAALKKKGAVVRSNAFLDDDLWLTPFPEDYLVEDFDPFEIDRYFWDHISEDAFLEHFFEDYEDFL